MKQTKLHLGCGERHLDDYINIDSRSTPAVDLLFDVSKLPYEDNSIETIESYHVLEHFPVCLWHNAQPFSDGAYSSIVSILAEWNRVMKPDAKLVIEVPDFDAIAAEYVKADEARKEELLTVIFGAYRANDDRDIHRWGVNKRRLTYVLEKANFREITFSPAQDYHTKTCPCLRVEAVK